MIKHDNKGKDDGRSKSDDGNNDQVPGDQPG